MVTQKTRRLVTRVALWGAALLLLVAVLFLGLSAFRVFTRMQEVAVLREAAEAERDALKARNSELTESLGALDTPRGVEAEIRARYPLVKPGEIEFVLVGNAAEVPVDTSTSTRDSIWTTIRNWMGD